MNDSMKGWSCWGLNPSPSDSKAFNFNAKSGVVTPKVEMDTVVYAVIMREKPGCLKTQELSKIRCAYSEQEFLQISKAPNW